MAVSKSDSDDSKVVPSAREMRAWVSAWYGDISKCGWRVRLEWKYGYISPEMWYWAVVDRLVNPGTRWIDVGGGKTILPGSHDFSQKLASRCELLVGVDPSDNIHSNPFVDEKAQCTIEEYQTDRRYDLATLRMVAEHICHPSQAVDSLSRLVSRSGKVLVYTPYRYSLASMAGTIVPQRLHHRFASLLWRVREEDVFPTVYGMNTRSKLRKLFQNGGFREVAFVGLDDCSLLARWQTIHVTQLSLWRGFRSVCLPYPERNLLGIYEKLE